MRRSIFLWRMILVLAATVLLASLLVMGGYMFLSRETFTEIKLNELLPKTEAMGQLLREYHNGEISTGAYFRTNEKMVSAANAACLVVDTQSNIRYIKTEPLGAAGMGVEALLYEAAAGILTGKAVDGKRVTLPDGGSALLAGVPVYSDGGEPLGAVLLIKSAAEIDAATGELNGALLMAVLVVFPLILLVSTFSMRRIAEPLHKMGEVAIQMSRGDFLVRADETESGEVGLLARALNTLCENLSQTIYQLQSEKGQLNQILHSFTEGIAATDSVGTLTHYNPALMRMFGTVRVASRRDLVPDEAVWKAFDEVYVSGTPQTIHYPLSGDRMLWITISPVITESGARTGVVGLFKDMTEMERLERTRREYVANVSHELRTPLTAVRGLLEPLADGMVQDEADRQRYYKIMLKEVLRLSRLITDMLELSRLQAGTDYMEPIAVDINELLADVQHSYHKQAAEKGIELRLTAPKLPQGLTDPDRIEQVLVILLDNAMRYTPAGGSITIRAEVYDRINISVEDTGCGIPAEDTEHIFDRFYKVDKSRREGGTGIGLSIAKFIMEKLGESIIVESTLGKGTAFTFTVKRYVSNAIALGPANEEWRDAYLNAPAAAAEEQPAEEADSKKSALLQRRRKKEQENLPSDAPYEVLPEAPKEKPKDKKKRKS